MIFFGTFEAPAGTLNKAETDAFLLSCGWQKDEGGIWRRGRRMLEFFSSRITSAPTTLSLVEGVSASNRPCISFTYRVSKLFSIPTSDDYSRLEREITAFCKHIGGDLDSLVVDERSDNPAISLFGIFLLQLGAIIGALAIGWLFGIFI